MNLLLLIIIAHLMSDFIFQTNNIVYLKSIKKKNGYLYHSMVIYLLTLLLINLFYSFWVALLFSFSITITHIIIDFIKEKLNSEKPKLDLLLFLTDQIVHLITIYLIWKIIITYINIHTFSFSINLTILNIHTNLTELLLFIIFYLFVVFGGSILLEKILNLFDINTYSKSNNQDNISMGKYIGIIERALILTLVTFGSLSSIGIIFTAKSLARFQEFDEKDFVEYYLLGTLYSIFIALIGGLILKNILM